MELVNIPGYHNILNLDKDSRYQNQDIEDEDYHNYEDEEDDEESSEEPISDYIEVTDYNRRTSRFKDAIWYNKFYKITVGGAGGIGSHLTMLLSRLGHTITVWDNDSVGEENIGGQAYTVSQIHVKKVYAVQELSKLFSGENNVIPRFEKVTNESLIESICFSCFDNMEARKNLFESWKEEAIDNEGDIPCVFIDGRLLYSNIQIYIVTKDNMDRYKETLFEDSEVVRENCALKVTTHYAYMIAAYMVSMLTNYLSNYIKGAEITSLPFSIKTELTSLYYEVEY